MLVKAKPLAIIAVSCLGAVILALFVLRPDGRETPHLRNAPNDTLLPTSEEIVQQTPATTSDVVMDDTNSLVLSSDCPNVLDNQVLDDVECLQSVERFFLNEPVYTTDYVGMVPREGSFTYKMMFQNHESDKKLVIQALSRPECYLIEGPIRLDLREKCHADAFSRYAYFLKYCRHVSDDASDEYHDGSHWFKPDDLSGEKSIYQATLEELNEYRTEGDLDQYFARRNQFREFLLKDIWIKDVCPSHDSSELLPYLPDYDFSDLINATLPINKETIGEKLARVTPSNPMGPEQTRPSSEMLKGEFVDKDAITERPLPYITNQFDLIRGVAARLGVDWLLINQDWGSLYWDHVFWQSYQETLPWKRYLDDAIDDAKWERTSAVLNAIRGLVALEQAGYESDIQEMVVPICDKEERTEGLEDCATAISNTETLLEPTAIDELRMLDKFGEAAMKLDIYQLF